MIMNKEQKTLTLTLPFVDLKDSEKNSYERNSYDNNGAFFVRNKVGCFEIVVVSGDNNNDVWNSSIPEGVTEQLFSQLLEWQQINRFHEIHARISELQDSLKDMMEYNAGCLKARLESVQDSTRCIEESISRIDGSLFSELADIKELAAVKIQESAKANGGYVDQETLLQIIKEVKK